MPVDKNRLYVYTANKYEVIQYKVQSIFCKLMSSMFLSANSMVDREEWQKTIGKRSFFRLRYFQIALLGIIILSLLLIPTTPVLADDSSWKPPSSVDISEYVSNPESAYLSDNNYAVALGENASAVYADFGFNIPADATIHGIEVRAEVRACSPVCNSSVTIALSSDGGSSFTSGYSINDIDFVDSFITLGGDSDTWGNTWTDDSFSNTNFKLRLEANAGVDAVFIDVLEVKVYYTPAITGPSFTVTAIVSGGHGSVDPATQTVGYGETARVDIYPDTGYYIASITDNGSPVDKTNPYILVNVTENHDIVVQFSTVPTFTVTASVSGGHGKVSPAMQIVAQGETARIDITPDADYVILSITDNGKSVNRTNPYVITNITSDHDVIVSFIRGRTVTSSGQMPNDSGTRNQCPLTLQVDMMGDITTASMTTGGVLCQECLAASPDKQHQLYLEEGTILSSAEHIIPKYIRFQEAADSLPSPDDGVLVSAVFEVDAFQDGQSTNSIPIILEPAGRLSLPYDENSLPEDASWVNVAYYDTSHGWSQIEGIAGPAEIGTARGEVGHFTDFAVIAGSMPEADSDLIISNLSIRPDKVNQNEEISISANIINEGDAVSGYIARLIIDGKVIESQIHNLTPQERKPVSFITVGYTSGVHQVKIGSLNGQFEVIAEQTHKTDWIIWVIIGVIVFCLWRFRRTWIRSLRQLFNKY